MRQFYLRLKGRTLCDQLQWSHYRYLLPILDDKKFNYYIYITAKLNLSVRELREKIKNNEYERIGKKQELEKPKVNTLIKNPIIIKTNKNIAKVNEYVLHQLILEDMDNFLKELGIGFMYAGNEVKIKIGERYNYIDFLLFNVKYNCYVVIELKVTEVKAEHIGQITKYINYVDKHIKEVFNDKTVGVIICRKENKFIMEYCTDAKIFSAEYKIVN